MDILTVLKKPFSIKNGLTWIERIGTIFVCIGVPLISFVKIEGMICMFLGQICWMTFSYKKKYWAFFVQSSFLEMFNVVGFYYWIQSGKGSWLV